jgi:hypothetical protein
LIIEPKREDLSVLIEINRNIAAGLQVLPQAVA